MNPKGTGDKKGRRPSIALINQSGSPDIKKTFADALGVGLLGSGRVIVQDILLALNALDKEFTSKNWKLLEEKLKTSAEKVGPLKIQVVDKLTKGELGGNVAILQASRVARATSVVFLDCEYEKKDCVVKLMERNIDMVDLFIETIINILMNKVVEANEFINVPNVKKMGTVRKFPVQDIGYVSQSSQSTKQKTAKQKTGGSAPRLILIQEKLDGVEFSDIHSQSDLLTALYLLCKGLTELQEKYNFVHRDFHKGNVMYEKISTNVSIIDFGYACFTIKDTPGSIQTVNGGYGYNQIEEYKSHIPCVNKSHDICTLILSLLTSEKNKNILWLLELGQRICTKYLSVINERSKTGKTTTFESPSGFQFIHKQLEEKQVKGESVDLLRYQKNEYECESQYDIFHPWYVYELFDIDIGMTPAVVTRYLLVEAAPLVKPPYTEQWKPAFNLTAVSNMVGNLKF